MLTIYMSRTITLMQKNEVELTQDHILLSRKPEVRNITGKQGEDTYFVFEDTNIIEDVDNK